jgi:hypothetical protein
VQRDTEDKLLQGEADGKMMISGYPDQESSSMTFVTLVAYADVLKAITCTEVIDEVTLLNAKPSTAKYNGYHILMSVSRE